MIRRLMTGAIERKVTLAEGFQVHLGYTKSCGPVEIKVLSPVTVVVDFDESGLSILQVAQEQLVEDGFVVRGVVVADNNRVKVGLLLAR